jgi:hypothetical protein
MSLSRLLLSLIDSLLLAGEEGQHSMGVGWFEPNDGDNVKGRRGVCYLYVI